MDWDRVRNEDKYRSGGRQYIAGEQAYNKRKQPQLGFKAKIKTKCPTCRKAIKPGQMAVKFSGMKEAVHRRCF